MDIANKDLSFIIKLIFIQTCRSFWCNYLKEYGDEYPSIHTCVGKVYDRMRTSTYFTKTIDSFVHSRDLSLCRKRGVVIAILHICTCTSIQMSSKEKSFVNYSVTKVTGEVHSLTASSSVNTKDDGLRLDDRDQGSHNSQENFDEEAILNLRDTVSSTPTIGQLYREDIRQTNASGTISSSTDKKGGKNVRQHKSRQSGSHQKHRRTQSSPNSTLLFSPLETNANSIQYDESNLSSSNVKPLHVHMTKSTRRARAFSHSHYTRKHYGALEGISENEELDMTDIPSIPSSAKHHSSHVPSILESKSNIRSHVSKLPHSELIESECAIFSQSLVPSNGITIMSPPRKLCDYRNDDQERKVHRRQRSVEQFMEHIKGFEQSMSCHDSIFAFIFIIHIFIVIWIGFKYGSEALIEKSLDFNMSKTGPTVYEDNMWVVEGTDLVITYKKVITLACICGIASIGLSIFAFVFMTAFSSCLIQVSLCFGMGLGFLWGAVGIALSPYSFVPILGIFALGLTIAYTFVVWDRIPLASTKLKVGLTTLQGRKGIMLLTFTVQIFFLLWSIFFTYATIGVYDALQDLAIPSTQIGRIICYVCLALSYFWVFQVSIVS